MLYCNWQKHLAGHTPTAVSASENWDDTYSSAEAIVR